MFNRLHKTIYSTEVFSRLDLLTRRFKNSIATFDLLQWLENFDKEDQELAIEVLEACEYFNDIDIIEAFKSNLEKLLLLEADKKKKIVVIPVGIEGKSGTAMLYFLKKNPIYSRFKSRFIVYSSYKQLINDKISNFTLVMIDDFFGSGESVVEFYEKKIKSLAINDIYLLSVVSLETAIKRFKRNIPSSKVISWKIGLRAFESGRSPFGYRRKMLKVREMCYKYGHDKKLCTIMDKSTGDRVSYPLGYKNTQALVTFSYGCPNNSLPILWSSKNDWKPLFPRMYDDKISKSKAERKENAYWLSVSRTLGLKFCNEFASGKASLGWKDYNFVTKTDFLMFSLVKYKNLKRSDAIICQLLGLSSNDFEQICDLAYKRGLMDEHGNITDKGVEIYNSISKEVYSLKYNPYKVNSYLIEPSNYVPKVFRGKT